MPIPTLWSSAADRTWIRNGGLLYNPTVVVETLLPSTEDYDRDGKFARYRKLDLPQEYLLVAQDRPYVEHYARQGDGNWRFAETDDLGAAVTLPTAEVELPLSDIYLDVFGAGEASEVE